jgi:hypothetical protein
MLGNQSIKKMMKYKQMATADPIDQGGGNEAFNLRATSAHAGTTGAIGQAMNVERPVLEVLEERLHGKVNDPDLLEPMGVQGVIHHISQNLVLPA